jgi:DNA-binding NarL/FixJ family response regulator
MGADQEGLVRAVATVATVANGGAVFGALSGASPSSVTAGPSGPETAFPQLTARGREVLDLVAAGGFNAHIAATLYPWPKTVRNKPLTC